MAKSADDIRESVKDKDDFDAVLADILKDVPTIAGAKQAKPAKPATAKPAPKHRAGASLAAKAEADTLTVDAADAASASQGPTADHLPSAEEDAAALAAEDAKNDAVERLRRLVAESENPQTAPAPVEVIATGPPSSHRDLLQALLPSLADTFESLVKHTDPSAASVRSYTSAVPQSQRPPMELMDADLYQKMLLRECTPREGMLNALNAQWLAMLEEADRCKPCSSSASAIDLVRDGVRLELSFPWDKLVELGTATGGTDGDVVIDVEMMSQPQQQQAHLTRDTTASVRMGDLLLQRATAAYSAVSVDSADTVAGAGDVAASSASSSSPSDNNALPAAYASFLLSTSARIAQLLPVAEHLTDPIARYRRTHGGAATARLLELLLDYRAVGAVVVMAAAEGLKPLPASPASTMSYSRSGPVATGVNPCIIPTPPITTEIHRKFFCEPAGGVKHEDVRRKLPERLYEVLCSLTRGGFGEPTAELGSASAAALSPSHRPHRQQQKDHALSVSSSLISQSIDALLWPAGVSDAVPDGAADASSSSASVSNAHVIVDDSDDDVDEGDASDSERQRHGKRNKEGKTGAKVDGEVDGGGIAASRPKRAATVVAASKSLKSGAPASGCKGKKPASAPVVSPSASSSSSSAAAGAPFTTPVDRLRLLTAQRISVILSHGTLFDGVLMGAAVLAASTGTLQFNTRLMDSAEQNSGSSSSSSGQRSGSDASAQPWALARQHLQGMTPAQALAWVNDALLRDDEQSADAAASSSASSSASASPSPVRVHRALIAALTTVFRVVLGLPDPHAPEVAAAPSSSSSSGMQSDMQPRRPDRSGGISSYLVQASPTQTSPVRVLAQPSHPFLLHLLCNADLWSRDFAKHSSLVAPIAPTPMDLAWALILPRAAEVLRWASATYLPWAYTRPGDLSIAFVEKERANDSGEDAGGCRRRAEMAPKLARRVLDRSTVMALQNAWPNKFGLWQHSASNDAFTWLQLLLATNTSIFRMAFQHPDSATTMLRLMLVNWGTVDKPKWWPAVISAPWPVDDPSLDRNKEDEGYSTFDPEASSEADFINTTRGATSEYLQLKDKDGDLVDKPLASKFVVLECMPKLEFSGPDFLRKFANDDDLSMVGGFNIMYAPCHTVAAVQTAVQLGEAAGAPTSSSSECAAAGVSGDHGDGNEVEVVKDDDEAAPSKPASKSSGVTIPHQIPVPINKDHAFYRSIQMRDQKTSENDRGFKADKIPYAVAKQLAPWCPPYAQVLVTLGGSEPLSFKIGLFLLEVSRLHLSDPETARAKEEEQRRAAGELWRARDAERARKASRLPSTPGGAAALATNGNDGDEEASVPASVLVARLPGWPGPAGHSDATLIVQPSSSSASAVAGSSISSISTLGVPHRWHEGCETGAIATPSSSGGVIDMLEDSQDGYGGPSSMPTATTTTAVTSAREVPAADFLTWEASVSRSLQHRPQGGKAAVRRKATAPVAEDDAATGLKVAGVDDGGVVARRYIDDDDLNRWNGIKEAGKSPGRRGRSIASAASSSAPLIPGVASVKVLLRPGLFYEPSGKSTDEEWRWILRIDPGGGSVDSSDAAGGGGSTNTSTPTVLVLRHSVNGVVVDRLDTHSVIWLQRTSLGHQLEWKHWHVQYGVDVHAEAHLRRAIIAQRLRERQMQRYRAMCSAAGSSSAQAGPASLFPSANLVVMAELLRRFDRLGVLAAQDARDEVDVVAVDDDGGAGDGVPDGTDGTGSGSGGGDDHIARRLRGLATLHSRLSAASVPSIKQYWYRGWPSTSTPASSSTSGSPGMHRGNVGVHDLAVQQVYAALGWKYGAEEDDDDDNEAGDGSAAAASAGAGAGPAGGGAGTLFAHGFGRASASSPIAEATPVTPAPCFSCKTMLEWLEFLTQQHQQQQEQPGAFSSAAVVDITTPPRPQPSMASASSSSSSFSSAPSSPAPRVSQISLGTPGAFPASASGSKADGTTAGNRLVIDIREVIREACMGGDPTGSNPAASSASSSSSPSSSSSLHWPVYGSDRDDGRVCWDDPAYQWLLEDDTYGQYVRRESIPSGERSAEDILAGGRAASTDTAFTSSSSGVGLSASNPVHARPSSSADVDILMDMDTAGAGGGEDVVHAPLHDHDQPPSPTATAAEVPAPASPAPPELSQSSQATVADDAPLPPPTASAARTAQGRGSKPVPAASEASGAKPAHAIAAPWSTAAGDGSSVTPSNPPSMLACGAIIDLSDSPERPSKSSKAAPEVVGAGVPADVSADGPTARSSQSKVADAGQAATSPALSKAGAKRKLQHPEPETAAASRAAPTPSNGQVQGASSWSVVPDAAASASAASDAVRPETKRPRNTARKSAAPGSSSSSSFSSSSSIRATIANTVAQAAATLPAGPPNSARTKSSANAASSSNASNRQHLPSAASVAPSSASAEEAGETQTVGDGGGAAGDDIRVDQRGASGIDSCLDGSSAAGVDDADDDDGSIPPPHVKPISRNDSVMTTTVDNIRGRGRGSQPAASAGASGEASVAPPTPSSPPPPKSSGGRGGAAAGRKRKRSGTDDTAAPAVPKAPTDTAADAGYVSEVSSPGRNGGGGGDDDVGDDGSSVQLVSQSSRKRGRGRAGSSASGGPGEPSSSASAPSTSVTATAAPTVGGAVSGSAGASVASGGVGKEARKERRREKRRSAASAGSTDSEQAGFGNTDIAEHGDRDMPTGGIEGPSPLTSSSLSGNAGGTSTRHPMAEAHSDGGGASSVIHIDVVGTKVRAPKPPSGDGSSTATTTVKAQATQSSSAGPAAPAAVPSAGGGGTVVGAKPAAGHGGTG